MNICFGKKRMISRMVDGDLSFDEHKVISDHILSCQGCSSVYKSYLRMKQFANGIYSDDPNHLYAGTMIQNAQKRNQQRNPLLIFLLPGGAFATATLVLIIVSMFNQSNTKYARPVIIENSSSIMNMPLGTLAYYEEYSGTTVQSQFVNFSTDLSKSVYSGENKQLTYPTYSSPLFYDDDWGSVSADK